MGEGGRTTPVLDEDTIAFAGRVFGYARVGHTEQLAALLEQGVPANLTNDKGDTLLILAAYHGHAGTVRVLLDHGADPERANDRGQTALAAAAFKGFQPIAECLVACGARVDGSGHDGRTALMVAAMFNRTAMVHFLLAKGADPTLQDARGMTAEEAARRMGAHDAAAHLVGLSGRRSEQA